MTCVHFLPAQGGRGREVIHPLLRPSYFQLLLSGGGAVPATRRRREAQLLPTNNRDLASLEGDGNNSLLRHINILDHLENSGLDNIINSI